MKRKSLFYVRISSKPIELQEIMDSVSDSGSGATVLFVGTVREKGRAGSVRSMEYEAYESMAVKGIESIVEEAFSRWNLCRVAVVHRTGRLKVKEPSVAVAVSSPHRREGFLACRFIIDSLKATVPIWKKELLKDGRSAWVQEEGSVTA